MKKKYIIFVLTFVCFSGLIISIINLKGSYSKVNYVLNNLSNSSIIKDSKISKISDLNQSIKVLDSNSGDTNTSNLELNYREVIKLNQKKLDSINSDLNYIVYPRLKTLTKESGDGYKYILTFQNSTSELNSNGKNVYYTRSKDLKNWELPKKLYTSYKVGTTTYGYSSSDSFVLSDGTVMNVVAKTALSTYNFTADIFNTTGVYVKYSYDNGKTWTAEKQIYAGIVWEPSIIQLSSGEIQVYFTMVAPVAYMNANTNYIASTSTQFQSTGIGMISSLDNGKTWTPSVTGTNTRYDVLNSNPYVPYRVVQQFVRNRDTNEIVDFTNLRAYNSGISRFQSHYGIKTDNNLYKMTDQMPVGVELNNKKTIVMAAETVKIYMDSVSGQTEKTTKISHSISLAYSNKKNVTIGNSTKSKYWLDINNSTKKKFAKESDVYNNEGLGITEVGPLNRVNSYKTSGGAPYILQMPSGETILYYSDGNYPNLSIGTATGNFQNAKTTTIKTEDKWTVFGSISNLKSHSIALLTALKGSDGVRYIGINSLYLNHTLDIKNEELSKTNDDALFIGSDSQAQVTIRANYDQDNLYFILDRLDNSLTKNDLVGLYINSSNLKYNGARYDYLHLTIGRNGLTVIELVKNGSKNTVQGVTCVVKENNTGDELGGYKAVITIPRDKFNFLDNTIKVYGALNNQDSNGTTAYDTITVKPFLPIVRCK